MQINFLKYIILISFTLHFTGIHAANVNLFSIDNKSIWVIGNEFKFVSRGVDLIKSDKKILRLFHMLLRDMEL